MCLSAVPLRELYACASGEGFAEHRQIVFFHHKIFILHQRIIPAISLNFSAALIESRERFGTHREKRQQAVQQPRETCHPARHMLHPCRPKQPLNPLCCRRLPIRFHIHHRTASAVSPPNLELQNIFFFCLGCM